MAKRFVKLFGLIPLTLTWRQSKVLGRDDASVVTPVGQVRPCIAVAFAGGSSARMILWLLRDFRLRFSHVVSEVP